MQLVLRLSMGSILCAASLFSEEPSENTKDPLIPPSEMEEIAANTSQDQNELPAYAIPRHTKSNAIAPSNHIARPSSFEGDSHHTQTLRERMDVVQNSMMEYDKKKFSANPDIGSLTIDLLYWKAKTNESFFGLVSDPWTIYANQEEANPRSGKYAHLDFSWAPGSRIGLEQMITRSWSLGVFWTFYHEKTHTDVSSKDAVYPVYFGNTSDGAHAKWKLLYNTYDLEFASTIRIAHNIEFKPYMGLRGATMKHSFRGIYDYRKLYGIPYSVDFIYYWLPASATEVHRQRYWGVGPRIGSLFNLGGHQGVRVFANGSASFLVGHVKSIVKKQVGYPYSLYGTLHDGWFDMKVNLQAAIGAEYKHFFDKKETKSVALHLSWETNYWWDMNNIFEMFGANPLSADDDFFSAFPSYIAGYSLPNEAITLMGITAGLRFEY